ncbi:activator-dependent family glycosyltransferase [Streptomyces sp. MN03-5084-2B]|nr:activator-dependent family glycosyltransferase [Streptomyces sp. MN03-5084-2B]
MRVLLTTYPERTHFLALVPLAWALRTAGHDVRVAVQPKFAPTVTQAGLTAAPVGRNSDLWQILGRYGHFLTDDPNDLGIPPPYDAVEREATAITWDYLVTGYARQVERWHKISNVPMIAGLVEFARQWKPDLVLWEPTTYAGPIAAKACGAVHGRVLLGPDIYGVARDHFLRLRAQRSPGEQHDPMADWLGACARKYGGEFGEDMVTGQFTVEQLPESLRLSANLRYLPMRYVPYGGQAVVPRWLRARPERPRIALTMGLTTSEHDIDQSEALREMLGGLAELDAEVVATVAEADQKRLGPLPGNIRMVSYVPLTALVPTCDVLVHHAGFGTLATTIPYAVPQLLLPTEHDAPMLGRMFAAQGAGLSLGPGEHSASHITAGVTRLLTESGFREGAAGLREEMLALPAPNEVVARIEDLVRSSSLVAHK